MKKKENIKCPADKPVKSLIFLSSYSVYDLKSLHAQSAAVAVPHNVTYQYYQ